MSSDRPRPQPRPRPRPRPQAGEGPESNTLGLIGFIISLSGILTCGLLFPIGLVLSVIGLFKQPRGFAAGGAIVGGLGTIGIVAMVAFVGMATITAWMGFKDLVKNIATISKVNDASERIKEDQVKQGGLPDDARGATVIKGMRDHHEKQLRYKRTGDRRFEIRSAGKDGEFNTGDDYVGRFSAVDPLAFAAEKMKTYHRSNRVLPDDNAGANVIAGYRDKYGTPLQYHRTSPTRFEIRSAGRDRALQTPDDVVRPTIVTDFRNRNRNRNRNGNRNPPFNFDD